MKQRFHWLLVVGWIAGTAFASIGFRCAKSADKAASYAPSAVRRFDSFLASRSQEGQCVILRYGIGYSGGKHSAQSFP